MNDPRLWIALSCWFIFFILLFLYSDIAYAVIALKRRKIPEGPAPASQLMLLPPLTYIVGGLVLRLGILPKLVVIILLIGIHITSFIIIRSARLQWQKERDNISNVGQEH
ncbi:MAG: hypothetical protein ACYC7E_20155 [Armatimonadota bacterium]